MKSVPGFPRIGENRELKKWVEDFLEGKLKRQELMDNLSMLRKKHWQMQKACGVELIPSNDFSLYDNFLDHAVLVGAVPEAYKELGDELEIYFALAKGYQKCGVDLKALPMKKWFFTNYHYIVPELNRNTIFSLASDKPWAEFKEALSIGIKTKPVILGALTFLKLARKSGIDIYERSFWEGLLAVYGEMFHKFAQMGCQFVQIDEPVLVTDLEMQDIELFRSFYNALLAEKGNMKIILQTYFGDIRDVYEEVSTLDFDGLGLDFVDGRLNVELIRRYGFPQEKFLIAGVVNGRNVFRNNYRESLTILNILAEHIKKQNIVLSTSCSLLFVPYSLKLESGLAEETKKFLAFAEEKLKELYELECLMNEKDFTSHALYKNNVKIWEEITDNKSFGTEIDLEILEGKSWKRDVSRDERCRIQKEHLKLPLFPVTTIGSFPQTDDVRNMRGRFKRGEISFEEYDSFIKSKIERIIRFQEEAGFDVLVHGEYERNDMVEFFGENLEGFLITRNGWVQSYGTRCVKPPIIFGDVKRSRSLTVDYISYAQSLSQKPVKGILTGPVTILNWSFVREDLPLKAVAFQIALAIREEVLELEKAGVSIIQIDEAALLEKLPLRSSDQEEYWKWALNAFNLTCSGVKPETQIHTHMCYSDFNKFLDRISLMDIDVITFEAAKSDFALLDSIANSSLQAEIGPGVFDVHSPRIVSKNEIGEVVKKMIGKIGVERLWINPDCGLKTRKEEEVFPTLRNMVAAVEEIRKAYGE